MARVEGDVANGRRSIDPLTGQFRRQLPREGRELFALDVVLDDLIFQSKMESKMESMERKCEMEHRNSFRPRVRIDREIN